MPRLAVLTLLLASGGGFVAAAPGLEASGKRGGGAVLIWPDAEPPEAGRVALEAVTRTLAADSGGVRPVAGILPWGPAGGFVAEPGREEEVVQLLGRLAELPDPGPEALGAAIADAARADGPGRLARDAAVAMLVPSGAGRGLLPGERDALTPERLADWLEAARGSPVLVREAGDPRLAARIAETLRGLPRAEGPGPVALGKGGRVVLDQDSSRCGLALAIPVPDETAGRHGPALALLAELLAEGPGSIAQRLSVATGGRAEAHAELIGAGTAAVLALSAEVPCERVQDAWRTMLAGPPSFRELPPSQPALVAARRRLDALAESLEPAERLLDGAAGATPWRWPPPRRWSAPPGAPEVAAAARDLPPPAAMAAVLAPGLAAPPALAEAPRLPAADFCPQAPDLRCPPGDDDEAGEASALARRLLDRLAPGGFAGSPFEARYAAREETPAGPAEATLELRADAEQLRLRVSGAGWTMEAAAPGNSARVVRRGRPPASAYLGGAERVEAFAYRQPAVLAAAVAGGVLAGRAEEASCGDRNCPALAADLPGGGELRLVLRPEGGGIDRLEIWFGGARGSGKVPDEVVRYEEWHRYGGVELASRLVIERSTQPVETWELVEWRWGSFPGAGAPAPDPR
ncbi:MAG: hypothetical protein D6718_08305 [Acidobacteria bacterium]|nr:MAG: hypothetical protein D6718_08305 [Acidobacteriota bacterium]